MRQSLGTAIAVFAILIGVLVIGALHVPANNLPPRQQTAMARAAATKRAIATVAAAVAPLIPTPTRTSASPTTRTNDASPTPATTNAATSTPDPTPDSTPQPTTTSAATPTPASGLALVQESNGMKIGCLPGLPDQYLTCEAQEPQGFSMTFYLFLPQGFNTSTNYPLVLLLEGGGERAVATNTPQQNRHLTVDDPYAQVWGPGYPGEFSEDVQGRWPSFVVIPQPVTPDRFVDVPANHGSYTMADQPNDTMRISKEIVDTLQLVYPNIDPNRRYLTGLSMGGYGAWEAAERWPDYWAAVAPIAGAGDPSYAARLVNLPIWAFQSSDDGIVPISGSRDMINAIRATGGNPKYTEYTGYGHGSWLAPYTILNEPTPTPDFFSWLFAQHR